MVRQTKCALVTGAGRGIGRGIAVALAAQGFDLVVNDLEMNDDLAATTELIAGQGRRAVPIAGDISSVEGLGHFVDRTWSTFGGLDCLVNNAGISVKVRDDMLNVTPESFDRLISVNLRGTFFLTQEIARRMIEEETDAVRSIITVSSANAVMASIDRAEYCIAKSGLSMMTKLFTLRLAAHGINVYEIRPGVIETPMTSVARERYNARFEAGFTPINRWGKPDDVGRAAATLASGVFSFSTGEVVHVDGGLHVRSL